MTYSTTSVEKKCLDRLPTYALNPIDWAGQKDWPRGDHGDAPRIGSPPGVLRCLSASNPRPPFLSRLLRYCTVGVRLISLGDFPCLSLALYVCTWYGCTVRSVDMYFARASRYDLGIVLGSPSDLSSPGTVQVERVRGRQG